MRGLTKYAEGPGHVELREWPEPDCGPGQVKIAIKAAGICGTDLHIYAGEYPSRPPVILGHECAGEVAAIGSGVTGFAVGDRVTALPFAVTCGACRYCRQGLYALCAKRLSFGSGVNGAFAPYLVIPAGIVRHLPEGLDLAAGALAEPLACCVKAVLESAQIRAGDVVLVIGPGPIGLLSLQLARAQGATTVLVGTASDAPRLELGRRLGAGWALAVEEDNVAGLVDDLTHGEGADAVVECAGVPAAVRMALRLVRKRGDLVQLGLHGRPLEMDLDQAVLKDVRIIGSFASSASSWERALGLLAKGAIQVKPLISALLPLEEWERGFAMARSKEGLKVLLQP